MARAHDVYVFAQWLLYPKGHNRTASKWSICYQAGLECSK